MKGSLIIVSFFLLGIVGGRLCGLPDILPLADISFAALCALMGCVGFSVGHDPSTIARFRDLNRSAPSQARWPEALPPPCSHPTR